jgi:hypothetical protein
MKQQKSALRAVVLLLILIIGSTPLFAQHTYKFSDELGTYEVKFTPRDSNTEFSQSPTKPLAPKTHELRYGIAWGGTDWFGTPAFGWELGSFNTSEHGYTSATVWLTHNFDYGYWINEWCSVGGTVTWTMGRRSMYRYTNHTKIDTDRVDYIGFMPTVRFAWVRRGIVQVYSSVSLGAGLEIRDNIYDKNIYEAFCAFDIKPLGLSVGRRFFGFIEAGYGTRGIINAGFGYRFNTKQK